MGVDLLDLVDLFNILCVPGLAEPVSLGSLEAFCQTHRAMLIADCYKDATFQSINSASGPPSAITSGDKAANGAYYFPWINAPDPLQSNLRPASLPAASSPAYTPGRTETAASGKLPPAPRQA